MTKEEFIEKNLYKGKLPNKVIQTLYMGENLQDIFNNLQKRITDDYNREYKLKLSDIIIDKEYSPYEDQPDINASVKIEESKEKYQQRIEEQKETLSKRYDSAKEYEKIEQERKEKQEKREYLRLKQKFGK